MKKIAFVGMALAGAISLSACQTQQQQQGTLIGGALGAALLKLALSRKWMTQDAEGRGLRLKDIGKRELGLVHAPPRRAG